MNAPAWNRADDAEDAVIATVLMGGSKALASARSGGLSEGHFFQPKAKATYRAICKLETASKPIDVITVRDELRAAGDSELVGVDWLVSLKATGHTPAAHGEIVIERARLRSLDSALHAGIEEIRGGEVQDVGALELSISSAISKGGVSQKRGMSSREVVAKAVKNWTDRVRNPRPPGTPTGIPELDRFYLLRKGKFVICGARPSVGKSALGLQLMGNSAVSLGVPWSVHTIEMGTDECVGRMFSQRAGISGDIWTTGQGTNESDVRSILTEGERIADAPIEWNTKSNMARIMGGIERWAQDPRTLAQLARANEAAGVMRDGKLVPADFAPVAMIDHAHIVDGREAGESKIDFLDKFTARAKQIANKHNVCILMLAQLIRASMRENRPPRADDLRGCGGFEENADGILAALRGGVLLCGPGNAGTVGQGREVSRWPDG